MSKIWVEHARHMINVAGVLEDTENKYVGHSDSELDWEFPKRITMSLYGDATELALVKVDGAWFLESTDD